MSYTLISRLKGTQLLFVLPLTGGVSQTRCFFFHFSTHNVGKRQKTGNIFTNWIDRQSNHQGFSCMQFLFSTVYELKNIKIILNHSEFNWVSWVMPMIYGQPIYILYFIFKFFFFIFMFPPSLPLFASVCLQFMRVASWRCFSSGDLFIYYCVRSMQRTIIWMSIGKFKLILPIYKTEHYYLSVCLSDWITWLVQSDSLCLPSSSVLSSLRIWWWHCLHCALNDVNENI